LALRYRADKTAAGKVLKRAKKEVGFIIEKLSNEEILEIATIVRDEFYHPVAAISVVAPSHRVDLDKEETIKDSLISSAEEITELLAPAFSLD
ncbi:IclR family transcriptional regulator C-terminal domain-containing protein, partial [Persephonella sp.]